MRTLANGDSNLHTAVRALAFAGLGWMRAETPLVQHGLRLYARALRQTHTLLQDPAAAQSDSVPACCRVFSVFEMFRRAPSASSAGAGQVMDWHRHVDSVCRLIQLRGPQAEASSDRLSLFNVTRATATFHSIGRRQPNAFTAQTWSLPREKILRNELYDIMSMAPTLYLWADGFNARASRIEQPVKPSRVVKEGEEILQYALAICDRLSTWEVRAITAAQSQSPRSDSSAKTSPADITQDARNLIDISTSHGDDFLFLCAQFWAASLQLHCEVLKQRQRQYLLAIGHDDVEDLPPAIDPEPHAQNLARTSAHFFRPGAGLWSAQSAVFPLGAALSYFARSGRRDDPVLEDMMKTFAQTSTGVVMQDFLRNIGLDCRRF